jgi:hypothetical protein
MGKCRKVALPLLASRASGFEVTTDEGGAYKKGRTRPLPTASLKKKIRVADAKEVGVGNPSEETCCHPDQNSKEQLN